jgi:3-ketoacyl-CoA synthase
VPNVLFRSNGAAVLLSSRPADATTAKYTIRHIVRTIAAADDEAYRCVWQTDDAQGDTGVALKKELIGVAARTVTRNMNRLGPLVLPIGEQLKFAANTAVRTIASVLPAKTAAKLPASWTKPYTPNFSKAFDAVCIHTGGRGVIDSMEQNLGMSKEMVEASRAALFQFGNTSSCSVWYELAYNETFGGVARGSRIWQLAFGSGFKCNSAVLRAVRTVKDAHPAWQGFDKAEMYQLLDEVDREVAASRARRAAEKAKAEAEAAKGGEEARIAAAKGITA